MKRILIVEDSGFQRKTIRKVLSELGYETLEAENGQLGLEAVDRENPDIIITDIAMPEMNGEEMVKALKDKGCSIPIIVLSSDIQPSTKETFLSLGARDFLSKPIDKDQMATTLAKV